jgi:hypothetical protein
MSESKVIESFEFFLRKHDLQSGNSYRRFHNYSRGTRCVGPLTFRAGGPRVENAQAANNRPSASSQGSADSRLRLTGCLQFEKVLVLVAAPGLVIVFRHGH